MPSRPVRALRGLPARFGLPACLAAVAVALAALILLASGVAPGPATSVFWRGTFGTSANLGTTLTQAFPLLLVALGWIVATRAGRLHVGYPGQIIAGGSVATVVGLACGHVPHPVAIGCTALGGIAGGAAWAALTAWLWAARGVLEIISSLLLNLIATQVAAWLVRGPLQASDASQPQSKTFPTSTIWPSVRSIPGQTLSWDVVLLPVVAVFALWLLNRTVFGFRLRASGANGVAARWAGIDPTRHGAAAIVISGAFAGLAGAALLFAGTAPWMSDGFESNVGFNGIAVALLARNSPIAAVLTAIVFSALNVGGVALQAGGLNVPSSLAEVLQGAVIVLVLVAAALSLRTQRRAPASTAEAVGPVDTAQRPLTALVAKER